MNTFSINGLLNSYFNTDKIELGENKPKLSKQLKKLKIEISDLETKFWGEAVSEFVGLAQDADVYSSTEIYDYQFQIDFSANLPTFYEQDDWAFDGSCNNTEDCGCVTSEALATYEHSRYCYIKDAEDTPIGRFYYFSQPEGFCVADWYRLSEHGEYCAPLALLLVKYGYKWEEIESTFQEVGDLLNENGFWSNFASGSVRKHYSPDFNFDIVTFKDLEYLNLGKYGLIWSDSQGWMSEDEVVYSDEYGEYIDSDRAVYTDNIDSWVYEDDSYLTTCSHCGNHLHLSRNYIEANGAYNYFCDRGCMENYFDIVEY